MMLGVASAHAGPYDQLLCPMIGGAFSMQQGHLTLTIDTQDGKKVASWTARVVNSLEEKSNDALVRRGAIEVEIHKADGGVFVHWGTLKDGGQR